MAKRKPPGRPDEAMGSAAPNIPAELSLSTLTEAAKDCHGCDLWKRGTQTVFGDGARHASVMFVGEQPGNDEDLEGRPFVGPAGRLLDSGLEAAGIDRSQVYVTNVVKHFKWIPRGKRRIHEKPNAREIAACRPWLDAEIALLKPSVIVCLGATAAQALLGRSFKVSQQRGVAIQGNPLAPFIVATVHPSSVLRAPDETRHQERERFFADLQNIARLIEE